MRFVDTRCLCDPEVAHQYRPDFRRWVGTTIWGFYPLCSIHRERVITPEWDRRIGQLIKATAPVAAGAVKEALSNVI
jgi:hypothetical protein